MKIKFKINKEYPSSYFDTDMFESLSFIRNSIFSNKIHIIRNKVIDCFRPDGFLSYNQISYMLQNDQNDAFFLLNLAFNIRDTLKEKYKL